MPSGSVYRRCDRCGHRRELQVLHDVELVLPLTEQTWWRGKLCDLCIDMGDLLEELGVLSKDVRFWFRAP